MTQQTYRVVSPGGDIIATGKTLDQATHIALTYDGAEWQVVRNSGAGVWILQTRKPNAALRAWTDTVLTSTAQTQDSAVDDIMQEVLFVDWPGTPSIEPEPAILTMAMLDDIRERLASADDAVASEALDEIGGYAGTGTPADEGEAIECGPDYICALDDGRVVAWGSEYVRRPGAVGRKVIVL